MVSINARFFLFDMDGTIVDSRAVVEFILKDFSSRYHLDLDEVIAYAHGKRSIDTVTHFIGNHPDALKEVKNIDDTECNMLTGVKCMNGAKALLDSIGLDNWALVTSAGEELAVKRMTAAGLPIPKVTVFAHDVKKGKPDPEGYLLAAKRKNISIQDCIVFEDAPAGIEAGIASGAKAVIAVNGFTDVTGMNVLEAKSLTDLHITKQSNDFLITLQK